MQKLKNVENTNSAISASTISYEWLERLLPKLLILPQSYGDARAHEREAIQKAIAACEKLLARRSEVRRLQKLIDEARQSETTLNQVSKLRTFFNQQTFLGDANSREGQLAFEMRVAMAEGHYRQIPKDILKILSDWETIIESEVGEKRIQACEKLMSSMMALRTQWHTYFQSRKKSVFGLKDRLQLLSVARRVAKLKKSVRVRQNQVSLQAQQLQRAHEQLTQLVAKVALFHSIPTANCASLSLRVQQLIMLSLEKEASLALQNQCVDVEQRIQSVMNHVNQKCQQPKQARAYIDKSEHIKNQKRMSLLTRRGVETFDLVSKAAEYQIRAAFSDVEKELAQSAHNVSQLQDKQAQLVSEMKRLKNLYNDAVAQGGVRHEHETRYVIRPSANT